MKYPAIKKLKKKTNTLFSYKQLPTTNSPDNDTGDPTNTTITILTTAGGPALSFDGQTRVKQRL